MACLRSEATQLSQPLAQDDKKIGLIGPWQSLRRCIYPEPEIRLQGTVYFVPLGSDSAWRAHNVLASDLVYTMKCYEMYCILKGLRLPGKA